MTQVSTKIPKNDQKCKTTPKIIKKLHFYAKFGVFALNLKLKNHFVDWVFEGNTYVGLSA